MNQAQRIYRTMLAGQYAQALELHAAWAQPTAQADRWAGYCLFCQGELLLARDMLLRALKRNAFAAAVELATVYRHLRQLPQAWEMIRTLDQHPLSPLDQALAHRERGALLFEDGRLHEAEDAFERAWQLLQDVTEGAVRANTAYALGYIQSFLGKDRRALHHLNFALDHTQGSRRLHPLLARAFAYQALGRFDLAEQDLAEAETLGGDIPMAQGVLAYSRGALHRTQGRWGAALEHLERASKLARDLDDRGTECFAELDASLVLVATGRHTEAHLKLCRANELADAPRARAHYLLRLGHLQVHTAHPDAAQTLQAARALCQNLHLQRELTLADLHAADLALRDQDEPGADAAIQRVLEGRYALGHATAIVSELRGLPRVFERLQAAPAGHPSAALLDDWRALSGVAPLSVRLQSLGQPQLRTDHGHVRLAMRRCLEVMVYLLIYPNSTREKLVTALWPDDLPARAVNYFHQVRHELEHTVPGLRLRYDRTTRTYALCAAGLQFSWDVADVKSALSEHSEDGLHRALHLYAGPLLPDTPGEWLRMERDALEWSLIKTGLHLMERWSEAGEYAKCLTLAERLLEIDPVNDVLAEYLLQATWELQGKLGTRRQLAELTSRFNDQMGEVPPTFAQWHRRVEGLTA